MDQGREGSHIARVGMLLTECAGCLHAEHEPFVKGKVCKLLGPLGAFVSDPMPKRCTWSAHKDLHLGSGLRRLGDLCSRQRKAGRWAEETHSFGSSLGDNDDFLLNDGLLPLHRLVHHRGLLHLHDLKLVLDHLGEISSATLSP